MIRVLSKGKYVLTGGHPGAWFRGHTDERYKQISDVFTECERTFPRLGYMFPDDFASLLDELYQLRDFSIPYSEWTGITVRFKGKLTLNETIVVEFDTTKYHLDGNIYFDGLPIRSFYIRGNKIIAIFPQVSYINHCLNIPLIPQYIHFPKDGFIEVPNPAKGKVNIIFKLELFKTAKIKIFDVIGRLVYYDTVLSSVSDRVGFSWNRRSRKGVPLPSGVYFIKIERENTYNIQKIVFID